MIHKRLTLMTLLFSLIALLGHAKSAPSPVRVNEITGTKTFDNHVPYQGEDGGVEFRTAAPRATTKEEIQIAKDTHPFSRYFRTVEISFGKTVFPGNKPDQYWIDLSLFIESHNSETFFAMAEDLGRTLSIATTNGILTFELPPIKTTQFRYKMIIKGGGQDRTYYIVHDNRRINISQEQFLSIINHSHLGYEAFTSMGMAGVMILEGKRWQKFQKDLQKLQNLTHKF